MKNPKRISIVNPADNIWEYFYWQEDDSIFIDDKYCHWCHMAVTNT